jgi:23S rRNA (uracil1939-C5)-methyltransferase
MDFEAVIEKVGHQGDGLTADGRPVPLSLPGERVRARSIEDRSGKRHNRLLEVLEASPQRVAPPCPHFERCGGCALQHWDMNAYSAWKREIVQTTLERAGFAVTCAPILTSPPHSRRRVGLHARRQGKTVEIGFKARRSWDLVPIHTCPISDPAIVKALPPLKALAAGLFEHPKSAPILHVTASETGLDIDISGIERGKSGGLSADARMTIATTAAEADFARVTVGGEIVYGARPARVRFGAALVDLPAGSFLQATPQAETAMSGLVTAAVAGANKVSDLFCGAGTFTFPLAEKASVVALDGAGEAIAALKRAVATAPGLKAIAAETRDLFRRPLLAEEMRGLDAVVFDPPRAGAEAQAAEIARSKVARVVGVSCNPQTFARDARILGDAGFSLDSVTPVDQFLWSSHVELVAVFSR